MKTHRGAKKSKIRMGDKFFTPVPSAAGCSDIQIRTQIEKVASPNPPMHYIRFLVWRNKILASMWGFVEKAARRLYEFSHANRRRFGFNKRA